MLHEGRIPLNDAEHEAVDAIAAKNAGAAVSITRRDPGETGPLLVHAGDDVYEVDEHGQARKQRRRKAAR